MSNNEQNDNPPPLSPYDQGSTGTAEPPPVARDNPSGSILEQVQQGSATDPAESITEPATAQSESAAPSAAAAQDGVSQPTAPAINSYGSDNAEVTAGSELAEQLRGEIRKALIGQADVVEQVLIALFAGGHVLLEGVPGLGKTLLVRALSQCMGGTFSRVQFTPDLMPSDVTGHAMYDMQTEQFNIRRGPVFCNFLLADEINRAPAKTQAALLEVMQERQVTIEGESQQLPPPFMVMATQNPVEQEGTYPLPEAQLDRFLLKVLIDYPSEQDEHSLVDLVCGSGVGQTLDVDNLKTLASIEQIVQLQKLVQQIQVDQRITQYAVEIVRSTREWSGISIGAGPRGSIALILAARAAALLVGRDFVLPDDVKSIAVAALRHRILLAPELEMEGRRPDEVIAELVNSITAPRM